jgi:hypothetical protein
MHGNAFRTFRKKRKKGRLDPDMLKGREAQARCFLSEPRLVDSWLAIKKRQA